ncbi:dapper homolog 3-like [Mus pahari]|uniref:dapper homolog 3-like n=1 Tax=Mus pahari TaxID=10093 RepID=UPI001114DE1F|nr:dapper homolog 3-like [Mus pahari]
MDRERGGRSAGWRRLGLRSAPRPCPVVSSRGPPLGERLPGLSGSQLLPSALAARAGERLPGVRYEPHRKPDIRTALGGGRRGEARAPAPPIAVLFLAFCKEGGAGWLSPVTPRCSTRPEEPSGPSSPLLPPLARSERSPAAGAAGEGGGGGGAGGREEGGRAPGGGEARELPGARASCARGAERWRWRRRAQGQGMTDAPSACAYVRESGKREGACRAQSALPSLSLGSLLPPAPRFPPAPPPSTLLAFPFSALLPGLC